MKLIVLDCDGIVSRGEAAPFDLALMSRLARLNRQARHGEPVPAVTLNTGRPSPYVEAVLQAIDGWQPALFESGAGLYFPQTYRFEVTPRLTLARRRALDQVVARLDQTIVRSGRAYWQPGKSVCYTLFAVPPLTIADFADEVTATVAGLSDEFVVKPAKLALNIYPAGIDKGSGLAWLAQVSGIEPVAMAGAGDTAGDIDFLRLVGQAAAPANATPDVRAVVDYVSPYDDAAGLADILDHWSIP